MTVGSKVLFAGGHIDHFYTATTSVEVYDSEIGPPNLPAAWSSMNLSTPRWNMMATVAGDRAYFAGGTPSGPSGYAVDTVDIYDDSTGLWSTCSLSQARTSGGAASARGLAVIGGGYSGHSGAPIAEDEVDIFGSGACGPCFDYSSVDYGLANCVGHWPMDEVNGSTTPDTTGWSPDAAVNGPILVSSPLCQALDFDGADDRVDTHFAPFLNPGDSMSFSIHAKMPATIPSNKNALIGLEIGGAQQITVMILPSGGPDAGRIHFYVRDDGYTSSILLSQSNMCDGAWHNIIAVRDGTTSQLLLYIDGVLDNSAPDYSTTTINSSGLTLHIGANNHWSNMYYGGALDDLAILDRAVDAQTAHLLANDADGNCVADYWDAHQGGATDLALLLLDKAEVEWDKQKLKLHGRVALPMGMTPSMVDPVGSLEVSLSTDAHVAVLEPTVVFTTKGDDEEKWKYKAAGDPLGLENFSIKWKGAKFEYEDDVKIESEDLGATSTTLEIERRLVTGLILVGLGSTLIEMYEDGTVIVTVNGVSDPTVEVDVDDDGEVEVELPFPLTGAMQILIVTNTATTTVLASDYMTPAVGRFKVKARFDLPGLDGDTRPAILDLKMGLGTPAMAGSTSIQEVDWKKLSFKEWKYESKSDD